MDEYRLVKKYLGKQNNIENQVITKKYSVRVLNRFLISGVFLMICLCIIKVNPSFKLWVNKNIYQTNFSFARIDKMYNQYFGSILPLPNLTPDTAMVFNEKLTYKFSEDYNNGVKLIVDNNYLVPILESGIIVFSGNKDNYGNTIIVQQVNGIDLWYVGVENSNYKIYDYVEKGKLLGEAVSNEIYLYFQKAGEFLNYKEYLG